MQTLTTTHDDPVFPGAMPGDFGSPTFLSSNLDPRILLIDDERFNSFLIAEWLRKDGFREVTHATDALRALEIARDFRPDAVLLDLHMPGRDGWEILNEIRGDAMLARTAVIMVTGDSDDQTAVQALENGAWDIIFKPFCHDLLLARVRRVLQLKADSDRARRYVQMLEATLSTAAQQPLPERTA